MLVQLLHLISERYLIFSQHAQKWISVLQVKSRKYYVALLAAITMVLLVVVSNRKEDRSAVVLAVHCQERNEINYQRKRNTD
jgi:hypothetical protein